LVIYNTNLETKKREGRASMEKWEYKTFQTDMKKNTDIGNFTMLLNQQGGLGWELVSCFTHSNTGEIISVFKRKTGGSPADFEEKSYDTHEKRPASGKRFRSAGEDSSTYGGPKFGGPKSGGKTRTYGDKQGGYGKSGVMKGKETGSKGKGPGFKERGAGFAGKDSGYRGKESGFTGKGSGNPRKRSGAGK
jgi:hypothetical protein